MKVCIIGSSHAAMVARAQRAAAPELNDDWRYFVVPSGDFGGQGLSHLGYNPRFQVLTGFPTSTSGILRNLRIADHDAFVLIGGQTSPGENAPLSTRALAAFWGSRGVTFLPQPRETLDDGLVTRADCLIGGGNNHLKPEFAGLVFAQIRDALAVRSSG